MAQLLCKKSYHFESPARRIFRGVEGAGADLFSENDSSAKKVEAWVDSKGESTAEAKALAESVAKQEEQIREGTREDLLELYMTLFTGAGVIGLKENYNSPPVTVGEEYSKNGLLQVLEKKSADIRIAFQGTPDLRLLAYATIYNNFKKSGLDANYLPKGAQVSLSNGVVTVTYTEKGATKTASSELFPWSTAEVAQEKWRAIRDKKAEEEELRLQREGRPGVDLDGDGTPDTPADLPKATEAPTPAEQTVATDEPALALPADVEDEASTLKLLEDVQGLTELSPEKQLEYLEKVTDYIVTRLNELGIADVKKLRNLRTLTIEMWRWKEELDAKLDDAPNQARLDAVGVKLEWAFGYLKKFKGPETEDSPLDIEWELTNSVLSTIPKSYPNLSIRAREPSLRYGQINRPKYSKIIEIKNEDTGETIYIDVLVPARDRPTSYSDERVKIDIYERGFDGEHKPLNILDSDGNEVHYSGSTRIENTAMDIAQYLATKEARRKPVAKASAAPEEPEEKEKRLSKKKALEAEMDALFVDFNGSKERWEQVAAQYDKMVDTMLDTRVRALDHYRGSEAAARLGDIEEAIRLLEVAKANANDGTYEAVDAQRNIELLKQEYGYIEVREPTNRWVNFTPAGTKENTYDQAALTAFKETFQTNGYFKGYVPVGTYDIGGKIYKVGESAAPTSTQPAPTETPRDQTESRTAAAASLELSTRLSPQEIAKATKDYERVLGTEDLSYLVSQFRSGEFSYIRVESSQMPAPTPDGVVAWETVLVTEEGEKFKVEAKASVDLAAVDAYISASEATGVQYDRATLIQYLAYREVTKKYKEALTQTRADTGLNTKFRAYADRTEIGETYKERAAAAAEKLGISMRLDPTTISLDGQSYANSRGAIVDEYKSRFPEENNKPFMQEVYRRVNDVNPDGSGLWHVEYELPDGTAVILRVETPAVDEKTVDNYIESQKVLGVEYPKAPLLKYLGYLQMMEAYKEEWEKQRPLIALKYAKYRATAGRNTEPEPVAEEAAEFPALTEQQLSENYTGKGSFTWEEGGLSSTYVGSWALGKPDGLGNIITDGGTTLGPVTFKDGNGKLTVDGVEKLFTWNPESKKMMVLEL